MPLRHRLLEQGPRLTITTFVACAAILIVLYLTTSVYQSPLSFLVPTPIPVPTSTSTSTSPPTDLSSDSGNSPSIAFGRSAWFKEDGYLRFHPHDGLLTTYEIPGGSALAQGWECDAWEEEAELTWGRDWAGKGGGEDTSAWNGERTMRRMQLRDSLESRSSQSMEQSQVCINRIHLLRAMIDNSHLQDRQLRHEITENPEAQAHLTWTGETLRDLAGKRVLILGDSIDRYPIDEIFARLPTAIRHIVDPHDWTHEVDGSFQTDRTTRVLAMHIAKEGSEAMENWRLNDQFSVNSDVEKSESASAEASLFRMDLLFTFGYTALPQTTEKAPTDIIPRLEMIKKLYGDSAKYNLIILAAGLWDLDKINLWYGTEGYAFQDDDEGHAGPSEVDNSHPVVGLSRQAIREYVERYLIVIQRLRTMFPGSRIAIRLIHDMQPSPYDHPKFRTIQTNQIRSAQREIARRAGDVALLPFGELMRGQPFFYRADGIHPDGAANLLHMETVLRLVAES